MKSSLVIVYHRQPLEEVVEDGKLELRENKSPNGIVPTLRSFFGAVDHGSWVAWSLFKPKKRGDWQKRIQIEDDYGRYTVVRLPLTKEQVRGFYHVTSKEALWPILHSFPWQCNVDNADWSSFDEVNRLFAEAVAEEAAEGALVWVHDYNLWLVPRYLRELRPDVRIAFFHHTPFPSADVFNILPWREEIVDSLLACDLVGFHIPRYARNFVGVARALRDVEVLERVKVAETLNPVGHALSEGEVETKIRHQGQTVLIDTCPVGTNPALITKMLRTYEAGQLVGRLDAELAGQKLILAVGRVDYTKGTREMLNAFERLLERRPALRGKVKLVVTAVGAAEGMKVYREAQEHIEMMVGRINGRYSTLAWTPILLFTTRLQFEEILCYYRRADICWVTPLRDGLNLIAKEFIAAHRGNAGVLVLSEFTGAAVEIPGAVLTNPYSPKSMAGAIDTALEMPEAEQRERMARMVANIDRFDIDTWARHASERFEDIKALRAANGEDKPKAAPAAPKEVSA